MGACWSCPLRVCSGLTFLFFPPPCNLPGILRHSASTPHPSSCHGDGNLYPVESSQCLATRLQHSASCLSACAWAASYCCCQDSGPARPPWRPSLPPSESRMGALAQLAPGTLREYLFHSMLQVGHWVREVTGSRSTSTPDSPEFSLLGLAVSPAAPFT